MYPHFFYEINPIRVSEISFELTKRHLNTMGEKNDGNSEAVFERQLEAVQLKRGRKIAGIDDGN